MSSCFVEKLTLMLMWGSLAYFFPVEFCFQISVSMCLGESHTRTPDFEVNTSLKYTEDQSMKLTEETMKSYPSDASTNTEIEMDSSLNEGKDLAPKRYAKIHDFCLGIPFG